MKKITTFFLQDFYKKKDKHQEIIEVIQIEPSGNLIKDIITILKWAINNNKKEILLINDKADATFSIPLKGVNNLLGSFLQNDICCLLLDIEADNVIPISEKLMLAENVSLINSCIILENVFETLLENLQSVNDVEVSFDFTSLIGLICPHKFVWSSKTNIQDEEMIHIISPFRNCEMFLEETICSVLSQNYSNFNIYFIDDNSNDNSFYKIPDNAKIIKKRNDGRRNSLYNVCNTIIEQSFNPDSIICILDGDDCLSHPYVLQIINSYYKLRKETLATYGGLTIKDRVLDYVASKYSFTEFSEIRKSKWKIFPFRTFKAKLFYKYLEIDPNMGYMKDSEGQFFEMTSDMALMFSLFELCEYDNVIHIDCPLYNYRLHSFNDHIVNRNLQFVTEKDIRNRKRLPIMFNTNQVKL